MRDFVDQLNDALMRHDVAAVGTIKQLIARRGPLGGRWRAVGKMMLRIGELDAANQAMALLVEQTDGDVEARFAQAKTLARTNQMDRAWQIAKDLSEAMRDPSRLHCFRGELQIARGKPDSARQELMHAIDVNPRCGEAWLMLSTIDRAGAGASVVDQVFGLQSIFAGLTSRQGAMYQYALGRAYHDIGDYRRAYDAFECGAAIQRRTSTYDAAADRTLADTAIRGYDRRRLAELTEPIGEPSGRAILVTGMARSGSTLVEQILASHSAVAGGDELGLFAPLMRRVGGVDAESLTRWLAGGQSRNTLCRLYLDLVDQRFGADGRVVDKTLEASRYLGLAAALLPEAPIVWLRRNPLDHAWAIFRTFLDHAGPWSWDLAAIARHFLIEDDLIRHWQGVLGTRLLVLRYEDLIEYPEREISRLLGHCGLPMERAPFSPHLAQRPVTTFSAAQVRVPINRHSVGCAEPYRAFLTPFTATYGTDGRGRS